MQYSTAQYSGLSEYSTVQRPAYIQYSTVQYSTVPSLNTVEYSWVHFTSLPEYRAEQYIIFEMRRRKNIYMMYITKKTFGLIHVYFLYTVFRATYCALISKVTWLLNCLWKIAVERGWRIQSCGRIQLVVDLEIARGKNSPVFKKHLVPVAALGNNFIPFV